MFICVCIYVSAYKYEELEGTNAAILMKLKVYV